MSKLLLSDLKRIIKDKLFLVVCIIGIAFAIITPLLYYIIFGSMEDMPELDMMGISFTAKSIFFGAFSPSNNFGLMLPVFVSIIIFKDFSYGTIRNKIISGHSRTSIFISIFISSFITLFSLILLHALLTLGFSLILTSYQTTPFVIKDFWYLLESLGYILLAYLFMAALISFLSVSMKNMGLTIVSYIAVAMGLIIIGSILQMGIIAFEISGNETGVSILTFINKINIFNNLTSIVGYSNDYSLTDSLYLILSPLISVTLLSGLGLLVMNKKDIK